LQGIAINREFRSINNFSSDFQNKIRSSYPRGDVSLRHQPLFSRLQAPTCHSPKLLSRNRIRLRVAMMLSHREGRDNGLFSDALYTRRETRLTLQIARSVRRVRRIFSMENFGVISFTLLLHHILTNNF